MRHDGPEPPSAVERLGRDDRSQDLIRLLAAWALVHESADDAWKAAVARGEAGRPAGPAGPGGPGDPGDAGAFADGLAALVAAEKERLKARLREPAGGADAGARDEGAIGRQLEAVAFELAELRGRLESLEASIDALLARGAPADPGADPTG
ncbi:MAG: hypothetical protein P1P87_05895 [Trueperaceae bacterium]|nr:hypothetical protein [Trueperaceae bacterium]